MPKIKRTDPIHIRRTAFKGSSRLVTMCGLNLPIREWYWVDDVERATCPKCILKYNEFLEKQMTEESY